jgi:hypothetical protein
MVPRGVRDGGKSADGPRSLFHAVDDAARLRARAGAGTLAVVVKPRASAGHRQLERARPCHADRTWPGGVPSRSRVTWSAARSIVRALAASALGEGCDVGYLGTIVLLGLTLGGLRAYQLSQRRSDGSSPDDVQVTLELTLAETRYPLQRNVLVAQTGRYVFITAPAGIKDGDRLRFPRRGRANGLFGAGDLEVVIRVKQDG